MKRIRICTACVCRASLPYPVRFSSTTKTKQIRRRVTPSVLQPKKKKSKDARADEALQKQRELLGSIAEQLGVKEVIRLQQFAIVFLTLLVQRSFRIGINCAEQM